MEYFKNWVEILGNLSLVIGIPIALIEYNNNKQKERRDKEYDAFNEMDEKFIHYQHLCLENIELDVFDKPDNKPKDIDQNQKKKELIIFTILFSIFERAHLMYTKQKSEVKKKQWSGWVEYIESFIDRSNFIEAWKESGKTFDMAFQNFMNEKINLRKKSSGLLQNNKK